MQIMPSFDTQLHVINIIKKKNMLRNNIWKYISNLVNIDIRTIKHILTNYIGHDQLLQRFNELQRLNIVL